MVLRRPIVGREPHQLVGVGAVARPACIAGRWIPANTCIVRNPIAGVPHFVHDGRCAPNRIEVVEESLIQIDVVVPKWAADRPRNDAIRREHRRTVSVAVAIDPIRLLPDVRGGPFDEAVVVLEIIEVPCPIELDAQRVRIDEVRVGVVRPAERTIDLAGGFVDTLDVGQAQVSPVVTLCKAEAPDVVAVLLALEPGVQITVVAFVVLLDATFEPVVRLQVLLIRPIDQTVFGVGNREAKRVVRIDESGAARHEHVRKGADGSHDDERCDPTQPRFHLAWHCDSRFSRSACASRRCFSIRRASKPCHCGGGMRGSKCRAASGPK